VAAAVVVSPPSPPIIIIIIIIIIYVRRDTFMSVGVKRSRPVKIQDFFDRAPYLLVNGV
jgi:hypothetical protein